jgi:Ca2+-transporting ATPase
VYSGTLVVQGQGIAQVRTTGSQTEIGKIGKALQTLEPEQTFLQRETGRLVRLLAVVGLSLCAILAIGYGLTRGNWLAGLLASITLAMAILPNEFPVVLTLFLSLGAWRLSKNRVLPRHMPAVETLGAATVLCVDKTGTLTLNQMAVSKLFARGEFSTVAPRQQGMFPEQFHELVEFSILASQRDPFDPMEQAMRQLGEDTLSHTEHLHQDWTLVREYPLSPQLFAMSHVWRAPHGDAYVVAVKGAPEAIIDLCHCDGAQREDLAKIVSVMANEGLRVLGVARASFQETGLPQKQHDFEFAFIGLVGLADPVRPTVPAALTDCYRAGIRVVMITGDYPGTARSIAQQIGLEPRHEVITGPELDQMDDNELQRRIQAVTIFARVVPEQKLRLVNALKANGEVVAMTGDGVNDAPALKAAHIGIAMGGRGTDVAREVSALVLLDDDFSSIVHAVRMGRRIFDNLKKAMAYLLAIHVPIAGMSLIPVLVQWPLVLLPVHIAFLHLIIDPVCSVVFEVEAEETDVMQRPPRNPKEPLFGRQTVNFSLLQGLSILLILLAVFGIALWRGQGELEARALTFTTLIVATLSLMFTNRSWSQTMLATMQRPNVALWWIVSGTLAALGCVLYVPVVRELFRFAPLHLNDLVLCATAGAGGVLWFEGLKMANGWRLRAADPRTTERSPT